MLPKSLKYGSKVESVMCRSYRSNIAPMNGTGIYNGGDTITINIPTRNNLVLAPSESYLKFSLQLKNGATAANFMRWDSGGAHGIIQRIRVFHGSNLLSDIDNYNLLAKMMFDISVPTDAAYGKYNVISGTRNDLVVKLADMAAGTTYVQNDTQLIDNMGFSAYQINSGDLIGSNIGANALTTTQTYCLNLVSLVGTLCSQNYIPLYAMTSAPLRIEIILVDSIIKACACSTAPDLTTGGISITNCEYVAQFMELSDDAISMISSSLGGDKLQFVVPDYRNYSYSGITINASGTNTQTQTQFPIPAKFSSLKSLFITCRDMGMGKTACFPHSCITNGLVDYQFRIGSILAPLKAPNSNPEMFCELLKSISSLSDLNHHPSIEKSSYSQIMSATYLSELATAAGTGVSNINSGSFYVGLDLENYAGSDRSQIFTGYNSNTDDIYFVGNYNITITGNATAYNPRFDAFACFDSVIIFENNTAYIVF